MSFIPVSACRSCGGAEVFPVLDLGEQPLANALRRPDDRSEEPRYPLGLFGCATCSLVQLTGSVPPSEMFDTYAYFSSFSTTMLESVRALARRLADERALDGRSLVIEVASNDGYLLKNYVALGVPVLGIDPAQNIAQVARDNGVSTLAEYFSLDLARRLVADGQRADVLHANNVLAHVPDVNDFVAGLAAVLADEGVAVIETPYLVRLVHNTEFDTVYHEHVFYYSVQALSVLFDRHGLRITDAEELPIHGGSLRLFVAHGRAAPAAQAAELLAEEAALGVSTPQYYAGFADRVEDCKQRTMAVLRELKQEGRRIAAYGAAAKGTVLCNHFGIDAGLVDFVADRSPHKQGWLMPGVGIPIVSPERLLENQPDDVLLLAWNFADEIIEQQHEYLERGGRFVVPIPELKVVPA